MALLGLDANGRFRSFNPEPTATEHVPSVAVGSGLNELHLNPEEPDYSLADRRSRSNTAKIPAAKKRMGATSTKPK